MKLSYDLMYDKDMAEVHAIDEDNNAYDSWGEKKFKQHATKGVMFEVATHPETGEMLGFYVYKIGKKKVFLYKLEVSAKGRELGCHKSMLDRLLWKAESKKVLTIETMTPDTSDYLKTHNFLKECGFVAKNMANFYGFDEFNNANDGYCWTLKLK